MGLRDLFKSPQERERDRKKLERQAHRKAESAIETGKERIASLTRDNDKTWGRAKELLQSGRKAAAQRELNRFRATELLVDQLEKKNWICEHYLMRLENSAIDNQFAEAMKAINAVTVIDPEKIIGIMDETGDTLEEQTEIDKYWGRLHDKETNRAETKDSEVVPDMESLMSALESEVAHGVASSPITESGADISAQIGAGRTEAKKLLGDEVKK